MEKCRCYRLCENLCWPCGLGHELVFFDSPKDVVSGKILVFWQNFEFSGGKLGPKMDQNCKLWVCSLCALTQFWKIVQGLSFSYDRLPLVKILTTLSRIWGRKGPETLKKGPSHWCCITMKTFENLQLGNHKRYKDKTYQDYISSWDLSFCVKIGV